MVQIKPAVEAKMLTALKDDSSAGIGNSVFPIKIEMKVVHLQGHS